MTRPTSNLLRDPVFGLLIAAAMALGACAEDQLVNQDGEVVAIWGYDTVAYFTEGRPVQGSPEFEYEWQRSRWRFSSAANRDLFANDPEAYAPQYGGNCAGAMARGEFAPVDPEAWAIVDGRLYLNFSKRFAAKFVQDAPNQIAKANAKWEALRRSD